MSLLGYSRSRGFERWVLVGGRVLTGCAGNVRGASYSLTLVVTD
jgi:hypothetical protein